MAKIIVNNPRQVINGGAKKYYFKVKGLGGPKGDKGGKGDTGSQGPRGPQGDPCTVVVNSTATLEPGSSAYVTNTGSLSNAVLNFGIPQGPRGPQGIQGERGEAGQKGDTGPRGPQGERGTNATVTVGTTITTEPGTQAYAWNSSSNPSNAVINFNIPRGATGSQGPIGPAGQNFAPTIVTELPATGDESKLYLTPKAHTTQTATGNPITASVTEQAGALESFQLDGDTEQATYAGINLARNAYKIQTVSGVTFTASADGSITANGTATDRIDYYIDSSAKYSLPAGTYVLSTGGSDGTTETYFVYVDNTTGQNWSSRADQSNTITSNYDFEASVRIVVRSGVVFNNVVFKIQIEAGSTPTAFQPYVGGTPSPNPDYPQPIQTVTGLQTVEIIGKNLFDIDSIITGYELISATGEVRQNVDWWVTPLIPVKAGAVYTSSNMRVPNKVFYAADGSFISTSSTQTATAPAGARYMRMNAKLTDIPDYTGKAQLELGSTATAYAPYSKQTLPLDLGKNLFNKDNYTDADGYYIGSSGRYSAASNNHTAIIPIEPNTTYTVSKTAQATYNRLRVGISDTLASAGNYFPIWGGSDTATEVTLTSGSNSRYMYIYYAVTINVSDAITSLMLEKGATATTYAPYKTPIELCKLGTYQDYIYKDGDDWKVHKAANKITVDGSENWQYPDSGANYTFFQLSRNNFRTKYGNAADFYASNTDVGFAKADKFEQIAAAAANMRTKQGIGFSTEGNGWLRISVANTIATTVDAFKTWLSSHSTTIDYALATPTDTTITDTDLIAQLEAIRTASLENGTNTITNSTPAPNLAGDMEIGYYGYNPTNRYDKWLWLDINNNYEQIGS